ncbi:MAG: hybrid sensor histidine kinase/response regulator [Hydrogenophaga sp.]|nr:hybrid sensor histidine kinase/response regulator [Hydrogenophaga sp.]
MTTDHGLPERLLDEQVRLLARNVPALVIGTLLAASGTTALLVVDGLPSSWALAWLGAMAVLCLVRWLVGRAYRHQPDPSGNARWARWFVVSSMLAGLLWGALAVFAYDAEDTHTQAVVVIALAGIVASATQSLGPYFPAHLAFALPALLPIALRCLSSGTARGVVLGLLTLAFLLMAEVFARRIAQSIAEATLLRFENESLADALAKERDRAESANRAKTRFLATASHDLRQPIHAMSLFVPALKTLSGRPEISPPTVGAIADRMQGALDTMAQLLNRLLDISRLDAGATEPKPQVVLLQPLLNKVRDEVTQQAHAKGLRLRVRENGLAVHTDPAVLHTILSNLAGNAVRYTERGGVLLAARRRGERVRIEVRDSGVGIEAQDLPRVTEEFFQADNARRDASQSRGFGLGLSIVKRSADLLGSRLICRSRPGHGSVFAIELPAAVVDTAEEHLPDDAPQPARTVLVVDDDPQILAAMGLLLRGWGHDALVASNLEDALAAVANARRPPEVALIDMHLSADQDGVQVIDALRERLGESLRMAIVTGDTSLDVLTRIRAAGVSGLHKPVVPETLRRFIDDLPPTP